MCGAVGTTLKRVKLSWKSVPRAQQGWCGAPRQALQELRRGGALFLLSQSSITTSMGFIATQSHGLQLPERVSGLEEAAEPQPQHSEPCSITQQPFCSCSSSRVHVGNVGHRQNGFHGNSHFRDASEKIRVGGKYSAPTRIAKEGQRWAGCSSTPENKNIPGGLGCAVLGLFPAWAGWDICDKATPSHYLQSCWFSPKRPKGELWGARCCSGLLTPLALDRTGVKLSPFLPWSWTALQMLAIVPPFL